jgi:hypothetical protein
MSNFSVTTNKIHENVNFFKENTEHGYVEMINKIIQSRPFGDVKFYIHSFVKRVDDATGVKKMIHHPRLTKPDPTPGASLIRVDPEMPGEMKVMWTIPNQETFGLYKYKKAFADKFVWECINTYKKNPAQLIQPEPDDLSEDQIKEIYQGIARRTNALKNAKPRTVGQGIEPQP